MIWFWKRNKRSVQDASGTRQTRCGRVLDLPKRRADIYDWTPPKARPAAHDKHVKVLVKLFQDSGVTGVIEHWRLTRAYPEAAWMAGYEQLSERQLLNAMGRVLERRRPVIDRGDGVMAKVTCYVIPDKDALNVVRLPDPNRFGHDTDVSQPDQVPSRGKVVPAFAA